MSIAQLRQQLRQTRRALSTTAQKQAAQTLARHLAAHPQFIRSQHIAVYLAADGELSLEYVIKAAWRMRKQCYLPVLQAHKASLWFLPYSPTTPLKPNRYGILEPAYHSHLVRPAWSLDLVLTPLVAFDQQGHRLGMGGGFYDRRFAYLQHSTRHNPLIGVAHRCQQVNNLNAQPWDIPMSAIMTDAERHDLM